MVISEKQRLYYQNWYKRNRLKKILQAKEYRLKNREKIKIIDKQPENFQWLKAEENIRKGDIIWLTHQ